MCAIVDANVSHEVFGSKPTEAGDKFFRWINQGSGRLVAGGRLLEELEVSSQGFRDWASQIVRAGKMRILDDSKVSEQTERIEHEGLHTSNDAHILAVAQLSGARLLFSNDRKLQGDFTNKTLIDNPQGKVYSTLRSEKYTRTHRSLLGRKGFMLSRWRVTAVSSAPEHVHAALLLPSNGHANALSALCPRGSREKTAPGRHAAGGTTVNQATPCPECEILKEQLR